MYEKYIDRKSVENLLYDVGSKGLIHALLDKEERIRYSNAWNSLSEEEKKLLRILYMTPEISRMDAVHKAARQIHVEQTKIYRLRNAALKKLGIELFGKIFTDEK